MAKYFGYDAGNFDAPSLCGERGGERTKPVQAGRSLSFYGTGRFPTLVAGFENMSGRICIFVMLC